MEENIFFINKNEFISIIINEIMSGNYKKYIENTIYANSKDFEYGFMLGMNWAGLLTSKCKLYMREEKYE